VLEAAHREELPFQGIHVMSFNQSYVYD